MKNKDRWIHSLAALAALSYFVKKHGDASKLDMEQSKDWGKDAKDLPDRILFFAELFKYALHSIHERHGIDTVDHMKIAEAYMNNIGELIRNRGTGRFLYRAELLKAVGLKQMKLVEGEDNEK